MVCTNNLSGYRFSFFRNASAAFLATFVVYNNSCITFGLFECL